MVQNRLSHDVSALSLISGARANWPLSVSYASIEANVASFSG
jgi:hypothetical protein